MPKGQPVRPGDGATFPISSEIFSTPRLEVPEIGTGAAYASGEAFGGKFELEVPQIGVISTAIFLDKDDEGLTKELVLFRADFTATADNSAFDPSDADLENLVGVITFDEWLNWNSNQVSIATPALYYVAPEGRLYGQFVTRGADNIAAGAIPQFFMTVT